MATDESSLKIILLEIIDAYLSILSDDKENAMAAIKKCLIRFRSIYQNEFRLAGATMRVKLRAKMMIGFICSSVESFPKTERHWRILYDFVVHAKTEYLAKYPEDANLWEGVERFCTREIDEAITMFPIERCTNYSHLVQAFDMLVHWAHLGPGTLPTKENNEGWLKVDPWRLPRGKSMLVDYWWGVPADLRPKAHEIIERLASSELKSLEDVKRLREEVMAW